MKKVDITICRAGDGYFSAYCNEHPALFGSGESPEVAKKELEETLRITKEDGPDAAMFYPDWLDDEYEFAIHWDIQTMLTYYSGIITPTALGKLSGIHPKQLWAYMHGASRPRKAQVLKIETAVHRLGRELLNSCF
ncbi:MAG: type II toxin-antitoxin system HicB family antitoxin [Bacteroidales bacterium]|nr:type II toxin-antitoxin system HicB family antitoxin [Bacteroidales bacterium]